MSWLDASAFTQPALGTLSPLGIGTIVGPSFWQFDMALARSFSLKERGKIDIRAEAFNILNGVRLNNPGVSLSGASTFGRITSVQDPRIMQFALKYTF